MAINSMKIIEQFSIWSVKLEKNPIGHEQGGDRPFLVISSDKYNISSQTPIGFICSCSKKKSENKYTRSIELNNGCQESHVNISQIRTLSADRFGEKIGMVDKKTASELIEIFLTTLVFDMLDEKK